MQEIRLYKDSLNSSYHPDGYELPPSILDSVIHTYYPAVETPYPFEGEAVSQRPKEMDVVFSVFFLCFLLLAFALSSRGKQAFVAIRDNFFQTKSRSSIFFKTTRSDLPGNFLLTIQAVLLSAVFLFIYFSSEYPYTPHTIKALSIIGSFSACIIGYILLKWIGYKLMSYVFFNRDVYEQWLSNWTTIAALHALVMFIPTLLFAYVPFLYKASLLLIVIWFILSRLIIVYKSYAIFFNSLDRLHYLFLYLCTQEIIPLFLLYKGCNYAFNVLG